MTSALKPLGKFSSNHVEPSVKGGLKICSNGQGLLIKMATMPIKTLKNLHLQNPESFGAEPWYNASGTHGLPSLFK